MNARHQSAARVLGHALTLENAQHFQAVAAVWKRLDRLECCSILCAAIAACDDEDALEIMDAATEGMTVGQPLPAFTTFAEEARNWVPLASLPERKHYLAAIWHSLSHADQTAFWRSVQERAAA